MILVVEDTPVFRKFVCSLLGDAFRIPIREADCGETALPLASAGTVVVTDLHMPGMGGLQLIRSLRADRACGSIPIIAMSADAGAENAAAALRAGADAFFPKPFDPEEFVGTIGALLDPAATWWPTVRAGGELGWDRRRSTPGDLVDSSTDGARAWAAARAEAPAEATKGGRAKRKGAPPTEPWGHLAPCAGDLPAGSSDFRGTVRPDSG